MCKICADRGLEDRVAELELDGRVKILKEEKKKKRKT